MASTAAASRRRWAPVLPLLLAFGAVLPLTACGDDGAASPFTEARRLPASQATGLAVAADGRLLVGERLTGRIRSFDLATGAARGDRTVADLDTDLVQGGLLGLAAVDGDVVASYTADDGRITVGRVAADGAVAVRWTGPEAQEEANGGRLVVSDGRLVIGIGDLLDPKRSPDPTTPNGKLLVLADDGTTAPLAAGFNNPFALGGGADGTLWVADNAPGSKQERILRVTGGDPEVIATWTDTRVPTGIAVVDDDRIAVCNFASGELRLVDVTEPGDGSGDLLADDCRYGVVALPKGGLAYAAEDQVVVLDPADPS